jgi:hypothetical protein
VTVAAAAALDFESNSSHVIVVEAASSDGSTALASFTILVSDVNEVPSGTQDWYTTSFIDELRISSAGVLLNDSDVDGDPLTAVLSTNPTVGTLVFQEDGSFLYVPLPNFVGDVTFVYRVSDGEFFSEAITVTISVEMPRNVPSPSSGSDTGSIAQDRTGDNADKSEGKTTEASLLVTDGELETTNNASGMAATPVADESDSSLLASPLMEPIRMVRNDFIGDDSGENVAFIAKFLDPHQQTYLVKLESPDFVDKRRTYVLQDTENTTWLARSYREEPDEGATIVDPESLAFRSVLTTGVVFWCVRGVQIFATILAATPSWIQLDPMTILSNATTKKDDEDEPSAGEKIFDRKKT